MNIFHVSNGINPSIGDNITLTIGNSNTYGRGIYFSKEPNLSYCSDMNNNIFMFDTDEQCMLISGQGQMDVSLDQMSFGHTNGRNVYFHCIQKTTMTVGEFRNVYGRRCAIDTLRGMSKSTMLTVWSSKETRYV